MFSLECIYFKKINSIHKCKPSIQSVTSGWENTKRLLKIQGLCLAIPSIFRDKDAPISSEVDES